MLGGPGSGKGTLCSKLVEELGFVHLSAGELLREERNSGSENGELINTFIKNGEIVPVKITVNLIKKAMEKHGWNKNKYLIDGFPRSQGNKDGWTEVMEDITDMKFVLFLDCEEDKMIERINQRASESKVKRVDDNIEALRKRFKTFKEQSMPIVEFYEKLGKVKKIDANQPKDKVYEDV